MGMRVGGVLPTYRVSPCHDDANPDLFLVYVGNSTGSVPAVAGVWNVVSRAKLIPIFRL